MQAEVVGLVGVVVGAVGALVVAVVFLTVVVVVGFPRLEKLLAVTVIVVVDAGRGYLLVQ